MRLKISKSKNSASLYVIKSTYINKVHSTKIVEKLGTYDELKKRKDSIPLHEIKYNRKNLYCFKI